MRSASASPEKADVGATLDRPGGIAVRVFWRGLTGNPKAGIDVHSRHSRRSRLGQPWRLAPKLLRVGVVSTVGNYREHNEDNFYLPTLAGKAMGGGVGHRDASMEISIEDGPMLSLRRRRRHGRASSPARRPARWPSTSSPRNSPGGSASSESDDRQIQRIIKDAVAAANQEILGLSVVQTEFNNMGTTVVLALFRNDRVYVAGIGDSRAYRFRDGRIEQLTKDHSLAQALLEAGTITAEELPNHKFNHVLYLYLGSKDARGGPEDVKAAEFRAGRPIPAGLRRPDRRGPRRPARRGRRRLRRPPGLGHGR